MCSNIITLLLFPKEMHIMPVRLLLKEKRLDRGLSQLELAKLSSVSYGYISELENGKKSPTLDTVCKLAKALDCNPAELYECEED